MTADQIIEVLQAWKEGKQIEWKYHGYKEWEVWAFRHSPEDFFRMEYRVKLKPREWWAVLYTQSGLQGGLWKTYEEAVAYNPEREIIRVREVLD